jgi:hypothetical protein
VAVVLALAVVGLVPHPASANNTLTVAITAPGDGDVLQAPAAITVQASMRGGRVDDLSVSVSPNRGQPVPAPQTVQGQNRSTVTDTWHPALPANGIYTINATARSTETPIDLDGQQSAAAVPVTFSLEVPPAPVAGLKAVVDEPNRTVKLTWAKNTEPDMVGYSVRRKDGNAFVTLTTQAGTSYTDTLGSRPAATYQYQVIAGRRGAANDAFVVAAPTATSAKVTSEPPTPSTSTPGSDPAGGGGTGSTSATTAANGSNSPTIAQRGKVDLSGFAALLPSGGNLPAGRSRPQQELDNGFNQQLPFDGTAATQPEAAQASGDSTETVGARPLAASRTSDKPTSLLFMAAGLLATVVLMHLLWLREEVNREPLPALVPLEPDAPAADLALASNPARVRPLRVDRSLP